VQLRQEVEHNDNQPTDRSLLAFAHRRLRDINAAPMYSITKLGFDDPEHTRSNGYKASTAYRQLNNAGDVAGRSTRFNGSTYFGETAWLYNGTTTIDIGLSGAKYTGNDGYKFSQPYELNEAGQVLGESESYDGNSPSGVSTWLYNGTTTIIIGLTGPEHTNSNGYMVSSVYTESDVDKLNEAGHVIGRSNRYNGGSTRLGLSAWLYNGTTTLDIGLTGPEYTRSDGYKYSWAYELNEAGQVHGFSDFFIGDARAGQTAWLYDGAKTISIGLTGPEHTASDGFQHSEYRYGDTLNEAGQVLGHSSRFNGGGHDLGTSVWLYNGLTTIEIGLTGPDHTRDDGYKRSYAHYLNEAGQILGQSSQYNGGSSVYGGSAWLYNGTTTIEIGLAGHEHTNSHGFRSSLGEKLNHSGQVFGYSVRYNGGNTDLGQSMWLYNGLTTIDIGLTGPEHTRSDGYKYSDCDDNCNTSLNEAGQVIGLSSRYNGGSVLLGYSAWLYNGTTTLNIGLTGPEHTDHDGYQSSEYQISIDCLNEAGQVVGYSYRYTGGGQDAWLYDPVLDQTFSLSLSTRSNGYAYSRPYYLGEDGLVLGTYELYDDSDNYLGERAFLFTVADGLHDLGSVVDGGLAANGWDWLAYAFRANGRGQILGHGKLSTQTGGQTAYLLTPIIPEPSSLALIALCAPLLITRHRRPRSQFVDR
jgi:hypothetical protein